MSTWDILKFWLIGWGLLFGPKAKKSVKALNDVLKEFMATVPRPPATEAKKEMLQ